MRYLSRMSQEGRLAAFSLLVILILAGCGSVNGVGGGPTSGDLSISPGTATISTNTSLQFVVSSTSGTLTNVQWSLSGGDNGDPGTISQTGLYSPPSSLFHSLTVVGVTATVQASNGSLGSVTAQVTVTPGFLTPIAPENVSITPGTTAQLTAVLGQVGGGSVTWSLTNAAGGGTALGPNFGALTGGSCQTGSQVFTVCTITYTAPAALPAAGSVAFATATVTSTTNRASAEMLLNGSVNSNPLSHQALQSGTVALGSSGGNAFDFDTDTFGNLLDCCGGTLGALLAGSDGQKYVLSTNHVLAESDQGSKNDAIIQPGLPDVPNCDPTQADSLGLLTYAPPLNSSTTNSDSAVALVNSSSITAVQVNPSGNILELGAVGANGLIASAPPAAGVGEAVSAGHIPAHVVKSGRSTGLTCSTISSIATTVQLQYFFDCAETQPYVSKTFQNQILISSPSFSETSGGPVGIFSDITGDSGSIVMDQANAQPIGLLYATNDSSAVANPIGDVLHDLSQAAPTQGGPATTFSFVGGAEHAVECVNYDTGAISTTPAAVALSSGEAGRAHAAMRAAVSVVSSQTGVLGVAEGSSLDAPGRASVVVYTDAGRADIAVPLEINGVRTLVMPVDARSFSPATAAKTRSVTPGIRLSEAKLNAAVVKKQKYEQRWMNDKSVFAVGVGQSYDNPNEAVIIVIAERGKAPSWMPDVVDGLRVRYQFANRFHTSHLEGFPKQKRLPGCRVSTTAKSPTLAAWKMPASQVVLP